MRKEILLCLSPVLFLSHPATAACEGNLDMHGNAITQLSTPGHDTPGVAANKAYVDRYITRLDLNRNNGTLLSANKSHGNWFDAQDFCDGLTSSAILPDGTTSVQEYDDWHVPSRIEWLSACLSQGSQLDYDNQSWTPQGLCGQNDRPSWTNEIYPAPTAVPFTQKWPLVNPQLEKYDFMIAGTGETFNPLTGDSIRVRFDQQEFIRCIR